jgi:hypothetical protein
MGMLEEALAYLGRGWSVIPCADSRTGAPGKKPAIAWGDFTSRLPTEEEVRSWWKRWPNANIALITGKVSGVVAIDIDAYKSGGAKPEDIFKTAPTSLISRTGGGGFHLVYAYPGQHVPNRVIKDLKVDGRGDGGYVVLPPSAHASGRRYEWVRSGQVGTAPEWLTTDRRAEPSVAGHSNQERWLTEALSTPLANGEGRNDACARMAGYFAGKGVPQDIALQLVGNWNAKNREPRSDDEVRTTVESVYKTAYRLQPKPEERKPRLLEPVRESIDYWGAPVDPRKSAVGAIEIDPTLAKAA